MGWVQVVARNLAQSDRKTLDERAMCGFAMLITNFYMKSLRKFISGGMVGISKTT
jgi:hypothetical protein